MCVRAAGTRWSRITLVDWWTRWTYLSLVDISALVHGHTWCHISSVQSPCLCLAENIRLYFTHSAVYVILSVNSGLDTTATTNPKPQFFTTFVQTICSSQPEINIQQMFCILRTYAISHILNADRGRYTAELICHTTVYDVSLSVCNFWNLLFGAIKFLFVEMLFLFSVAAELTFILPIIIWCFWCCWLMYWLWWAAGGIHYTSLPSRWRLDMRPVVVFPGCCQCLNSLRCFDTTGR